MRSRPVFIQAPAQGLTYLTNISAEEEQKLLNAAAWATAQPNAEIISLGQEKVIVVR